MWSLLEVFREDFNLKILDIGAAMTERPPYQSLIDAGRGQIIGFEPDAQACKKLNSELGSPHLFLPYFLGNGRQQTFHETNWGPTGSLYRPNSTLLRYFQNLAEVVTPVATHQVNTTRLDDVQEITDVDFIKIDVQGSELEIFKNGLRAISTAVAIQVEVEFVELYEGQPMFADVDVFLRKHAFQFHTFSGFGGRAFKPLTINGDVNRPIRQYLWSDAIYVRDWMRLDALSIAKLRNYAVLAHDLFQSYDLTHLILAALDAKDGSSLASEYLKRLATTPPSA